jgi:hypothetical protein
MATYSRTNISWLGLGCCYCMFSDLIFLRENLFFCSFRVWKNIVELKVVILVFVMFIQFQYLMMMFNKVFLLRKH